MPSPCPFRWRYKAHHAPCQPCGTPAGQPGDATGLLELKLRLRQQRFDLRLRLGGEGIFCRDEAHRLEEGKVFEQGKALVRERGFEFEMLQLSEACNGRQF